MADTAPFVGQRFFETLVIRLAEVLDVHTAFITECVNPDLTAVRTLAYLVQSTICPNFEYELEETPCRHVIEGSPYYVPDGLEEAFPIEVGMASYLGVPIISTSGTILGHLVIIDEKPMKYGAADQPILEIFAQRAAAEIERQRAEEKLRQLNRELEITNRTLEARVQARTQTFERRRQVAEGLHEVLLLLNMSKPVEAIIRFIAQQAKQLLAADAVAICRRATDRRINLEGTINLTSPSGGKPFNFASKLIISERTVGNHIGRILAKLHLANRTQAALYALRRGLASFDDI